MRRHAVALLIISIIITSGCLSGQTIKRQAAEPTENISLQSAPDYGEDVAGEQECSCPDSVRTCQDGFDAACENECINGSCGRCMPDCAGHERCNESWFCGEWSACSGARQSRKCVDSGFCNKTALTETRACPDSCSMESDCPRGTPCSPYMCLGSPKSCTRVIVVPCCGDGECDADESCPEDCPGQRSVCNTTCPECPPCNETQNQTNQSSQTPTFSNISITSINASGYEFADIWNLGNAAQGMDNWTLADSTPNSTGHIFTFSNFLLHLNTFVRVHTENGTNNLTDLFWGRKCPDVSGQCIWNNDHDNATLKNSSGSIISIYSYSS